MDVDGAVLGAGMVLGTGHVLTCAHVVMAAGDYRPATVGAVPEIDVVVDFVAQPGAHPLRARVAGGCWVPPFEDERGDVALLRLSRPLANGLGAPLRRAPLVRDRLVHMYGFPNLGGSVDTGVWASARLAGRGGPGGEWVQMNPVTLDPRVRRGFSGSAVVDEDTADVLGMVVGNYTGEAGDLSWMIPVETIVRHVPAAADWVSGPAAVDPDFAAPFDYDRFNRWVGDAALARRVTDFLARRIPGTVMVIITGDTDSSASAAVRRAVVLSDRELPLSDADELARQARDGTIPPVGSIDLALDASGKTAQDVSRRIVDRMGISVDESTEPMDWLDDDPPSMTLVIVGIDDAADPVGLVSDVVKPLAQRASERGIRMLLGFRRSSSPSLSIARSLEPAAARSEAAESEATLAAVQQRLDELAARIVKLRSAERTARAVHAYVAARVTPVPNQPARSAALRQRLSELRIALTDHRRRDIAERIDAVEQTVDRALHQAQEVREQLEKLLGRRNELRGRLTAYKAKAADRGRAEDTGLAEWYRQAQELLSHGPCDLAAAAEAVDRYMHAVLDKPGHGSTGVGRETPV